MFFGKKPEEPKAVAPAAAAPALQTPVSAPPPAAPPGIPQSTGPLPPEELKRRAIIAKQIAASFGEIVTLMMRSPADRKHSLEDLEWMVAPALMTGQFAVADAQAKDNGSVMPIGAVMWAFVSEDVDRRLTANIEQPLRLEPKEWRSGQIPWIISAIGEPKVVGGLLQQLTKTIFKDRPAKMRARGTDGKTFVGRLEISPDASPAV
jgi:hemolysin-activating ACP:hemolysin acyltransferase